MIDFNTDPYFDDYDESKHFYKILFRPSYPVQARELTQLQTILQQQIARQGSALFQQGAMVIPGQSSVQTNVDYIALQNTFAGSNVDSYINQFLGATITGSSGVTATVFFVSPATSTDPHLLYVNYTNSGTATTTKTFSASETITSSIGGYQATVAASNPTGQGSFASIAQGVYFVNGAFVLVDAQTIILDKFGTTPSYRIGLVINESIVTPEEDESLLDNAQGSYNYAAPGAHRDCIELDLDKRALTSADDANFISLIVIDTGVIQRDTRTTQYSDLEKTLARRTYDESGSYTVSNFDIDVREFRSNNRGLWLNATPYIAGDVVSNAAGYFFTCVTQGVSTTSPSATAAGTLVTDGSLVWEMTPSPKYNRGINVPPVTDTTLSAHLAKEAQLAIGLEPGKAYVQGYEIEKIAVEYETVQKARTLSAVQANTTVTTNVGSYIIVGSPSVPPVAFSTLTLYDRETATPGTAPASGVVVGTARVRGIEYHSSGLYKLFLFGIQMNSGYNFNRSSKCAYNAAAGFTANLDNVVTNMTGSITISGTTITGQGTSFLTDLKVGDAIFVPTTNSYGTIATVTGQTAATFVASTTSCTAAAYQLCTTALLETQNVNDYFPMPFFATGTLSNVLYTVQEPLTSVTSTSGGVATFTYVGTGTLASTGNATNYLAFASNAVQTGASFSVTGNTLTVTGVAASTTIKCLAAVNYTGSLGVTEKVKTLNSQTDVFSTAAAANSILVLSKADGYKLSRVEMDTSVAFGGSPTFASPIDITDRYTFVNGQTESYYGPAYLQLKSSYAAPANPIRAVYQYFSHGTGHYFSVNSYAAIDYKKIPKFGSVELRDVLDFRPRTDDGVTISGSSPVKRGVNITANIQYYLSRSDLISLAPDGTFNVTTGQPALNAPQPSADATSMVLYGLTYQPYTFGTGTKQVAIQRNDNKRYTMRDIGKLETRIATLEYYTSLNMLEQQTASTSLTDANNNQRFKNGFVVDTFQGNSIGDPTNIDYVCSTDPINGELRPYFSMQNVNLIEYATSDSARLASNYKLWGDVITLPLDPTTPNVALITQPYGTHVENINPFAVFTFVGDCTLNPSQDDWFEVTRLPDIVQSVEGNFNSTVSSLASQGVLGTVWNDWQTQWTGTPVVTSQAITSVQFANVGYWWAAAATVTTTTATTVGQARTGITTTVVPTYSTETINDRVVSSEIIPYIRSRNVLVEVKRLKPNTKFYSFFDGVSIDSYVTAATRMVYTLTSSKKFDTTSNVGSNVTQPARLIAGDTQVCLNAGDILTGGTSGTTAIVIGDSINTTTGVRTLDIVNLKGTFTIGETVSGSIQDAGGNVATGTVVSVATPGMVTNNNGELNFVFNIPNTDAVRFRTGTRQLLLLDSPQNDVNVTSKAIGTYYASGTLNEMQATVLSVRNADVVTQAVADTQTIVQTSDSSQVVTAVALSGQPQDPLAQTFFVQNSGGAFLSKVDVFFASKDAQVPVTLMLVSVVNGYPSTTVLPFSKVTLTPDQVNISSNNVSVNGVSIPASDTPTSFVFDSPVYVADASQYAIVLMSDSIGYQVWISQMGEQVPGTQRTVSEQPNLGSLFKSQNASTWTADQTQDLMFTIWRAKFNVGASTTPTQGLARFVNDNVPSIGMQSNPFEIRSGSTSIRIHQQDHGLTETSSTTITPVYVAGTGTITCTTASTSVTTTGSWTTMGVVAGSALYNSSNVLIGTVSSVTNATTLVLTANGAVAVTAGAFSFVLPIAGIPAAQIFKTFTALSNIQNDSFVVTVTTTPTSSGYFGGTGNRMTRSIQFDVFQPSASVLTFPETSVAYGVVTTSGKSINSSQTPFIQDTGDTNVTVNTNVTATSPRMVANRETEVLRLASDRSLKFDILMQSTNDSLSPVIDTQRLSFIAISNRTNSPVESTMDVSGLDDQVTISANVLISMAAGSPGVPDSIVSADSATQLLLLSIPVGRYIVISGSTAPTNNTLYKVVGKTIAGNGLYIAAINGSVVSTQVTGTAITVTQRIAYMDEIAAVGSSTVSKYVTQRIDLTNPSTYIRLTLGTLLPSTAGITVYYRTNLAGQTSDLSTVPYTLLSPDATIPNSNTAFTDVNYTLSGMTPFDGIVLKIVLTSTNSSMPPRVTDLRLIACA